MTEIYLGALDLSPYFEGFESYTHRQIFDGRFAFANCERAFLTRLFALWDVPAGKKPLFGFYYNGHFARAGVSHSSLLSYRLQLNVRLDYYIPAVGDDFRFTFFIKGDKHD